MPSTFPLIWRTSWLPAPISKTWNLTLEEPAFATRIVPMASGRRQGHGAPPGVRVEGCDSARRHASQEGVGARGQDNRNSRSQNDAGCVGFQQEGQVLRKHISGF